MSKPNRLPLLAGAALILLSAFPARGLAAPAGDPAFEHGLGFGSASNLVAEIWSWLSSVSPKASHAPASTGAAVATAKGTARPGRRPAHPENGCGPDPNGGAQCGSQIIILPPPHGTQP